MRSASCVLCRLSAPRHRRRGCGATKPRWRRWNDGPAAIRLPEERRFSFVSVGIILLCLAGAAGANYLATQAAGSAARDASPRRRPSGTRFGSTTPPPGGLDGFPQPVAAAPRRPRPPGFRRARGRRPSRVPASSPAPGEERRRRRRAADGQSQHRHPHPSSSRGRPCWPVASSNCNTIFINPRLRRAA